MLTKEFWDALLFNPDFAQSLAGNIISALILGMFTLVTASVSLYIYYSKKSNQSTSDFLQWVSNMNYKFQSNKSNKLIRESLAEYRSTILVYIGIELYYTYTLKLNIYQPVNQKYLERFFIQQFSKDINILKERKDLPFKFLRYSESAFSDWDYKLNWSYIRGFTDYLKFFEEILLSCEELLRVGRVRHAQRLIDNFYWHIKSLLFGWQSEESNKIFTQYILHNHLDKLAEVNIFLISEMDRMRAFDLIAHLNDLEYNVKKKITLKEVKRKWSKIMRYPVLLSGGVPTMIDENAHLQNT